MNIGETLKSMRLHAGLTQKEMTAGIISESYYSKVERGVSDISADILFKLLVAHNFDPLTFFMRIRYREKNNENLADYAAISFAQNKKDIDALNKLKMKLEQKYPDDDMPEKLKFQLEIARAWVTHSAKDVDPALKEKAKQIVLEDKMDREMYAYLGQACILMDIDDASRLFDLAVKSYKKKPEVNVMTVTLLAVLCINFLNCCYHKNGDRKYIDEALNTVLSLPAEPHIGYYKILAVYYRALFNKNKQKADNIVKFIKEAGLIGDIQDTISSEDR